VREKERKKKEEKLCGDRGVVYCGDCWFYHPKPTLHLLNVNVKPAPT
jgi:hypothetical protein